jgi:hypothetical protein
VHATLCWGDRFQRGELSRVRELPRAGRRAGSQQRGTGDALVAAVWNRHLNLEELDRRPTEEVRPFVRSAGVGSGALAGAWDQAHRGHESKEVGAEHDGRSDELEHFLDDAQGAGELQPVL